MNNPVSTPTRASAAEGPPVTDRVHLLYAPTRYCNLGCRYCYLGTLPDEASLRLDAGRAVPTLEHALGAFLAAGVLPFTVSLHGGEVTTLPPSVLEGLFGVIRRHYVTQFDELTAAGYRRADPHVKTNLYTFHRLYDLFEKHHVSVSASIDLPLALHGHLRRDRRGRSWLPAALENLRLLARYPHAKKISSTFYREHLAQTPAIIDDIWRIHRDLGFDMTNFNVMFGFESSGNRDKFGAGAPDNLHQADEDRQLRFYEDLKGAFAGTELEYGFKRNWFDEFKPDYCTNAGNCGERFYLVQSDGSVYSCVRGQGLPEFYYGNVFEMPVREIMAAGRSAVCRVHQEQGLDAECRACAHLYLCHTGCPMVKRQNGRGRSYTCALQKALYRDNPRSYPPLNDERERRAVLREYIADLHPSLLFDAAAAVEGPPEATPLVPAELGDERNALLSLIGRDPVLKALYDGSIVMTVNDDAVTLRSPLLSRERTLYALGPEDRVVLHLPSSLFTVNCAEPVRNTLYIQMLRDTPVVYGDEQRTKQEHLYTHQVYYRLMEPSDRFGPDTLMADITALLALHAREYRPGVLNNCFVTTLYLRDYHYQKQKANAFYHIQAINLPFPNFEFYWNENTTGKVSS